MIILAVWEDGGISGAYIFFGGGAANANDEASTYETRLPTQFNNQFHS